MDQESWWGEDQFCPADQHATPRNEKMMKNWEVSGGMGVNGFEDLYSERQADADAETCGERGEGRETALNIATA